MRDKGNRRVNPKLSATGRSLPIALLRAREMVMEPYRTMLHASNISEQKWRVLRVVHEMGPVGQARIAEAACLMMPSLTRILKSMEQDDLLSRENDAQDRRTTLVSITEKGRHLIAEHSSKSAEITTKLADQFGQERLDTLLDLLEDLRKQKI
ncbi:MAG: homoprotocatechuate degradation operon regulator HpaR [Paracoccaceae bacterium]|jgi:homoprotocatechuate degradation regulator HpaR|nr:homoprotocatechuate degradation operon regulator HpaR [Paracoccaceae bacterium]